MAIDTAKSGLGNPYGPVKAFILGKPSKKKIKSVDFFHTSQTLPPPLKCGNTF